MDKPLPSAARENLRGRIARLEAIFRNLFFPVVVVAADGTIRLMNAAAAAYVE